MRGSSPRAPTAGTPEAKPKTERPPRGVAVAVSVQERANYRSFLRQLMRSPSVVVELETGALWLLSL